MNKNVLNEISQMKFLFGYKPGKVLSEQEIPVDEDFSEIDFSDVIDSPGVAPAPTRERERTREKERERETEKPFNPDRERRERNPDRLPYTNPDTHPQGSEEDETTYELELDLPPRQMRSRMGDMEPKRPMRRRMGDVDENIYEIEIDGSIEELFNK
jgi:hypothetical protein